MVDTAPRSISTIDAQAAYIVATTTTRSPAGSHDKHAFRLSWAFLIADVSHLSEWSIPHPAASPRLTHKPLMSWLPLPLDHQRVATINTLFVCRGLFS